MEVEGQFLTLLTFLVFGAAILPMGMSHLDWSIFGYAALSLTVIRMVSVAVYLIGIKLEKSTILFLGWFGPRGLVSILFALLILEEAQAGKAEEILLVMMVTVTMSALLHELSAAPFAKSYGRSAQRMTGGEETQTVSEIRPRIRIEAGPQPEESKP